MERQRRLVPAGARFLVGAKPSANAADDACRGQRRRVAPRPGRERARDHPPEPHLRASSRPADRHCRTARGTTSGGQPMRLAFFASSLLSSYWNGAATYYRGIIAALARRGYRTTFYEPDAFDRQLHRDIEPPDWAEVVIYPATLAGVQQACARAASADVVVKASGVGVFDDEILATLLAL